MDFNDQRHSGVVVLHEKKTNSIILTKRPAHLRAHPGEICFPGGKWEEGDRDYYATALRELHEELEVCSSRVELIKPLKIQETLRGVIIHPWYASIECLDPYRINPSEVVRVVVVPIESVLNAANYREMQVIREGYSFTSFEFIYEEEWIWGATAKIMYQLAMDS